MSITRTGLFLVVFAVVALSGPGRIDIVDGQARFEVAKSLALYGDFVVRNPDVWFGVFPGRNGDSYSYYRFPHSVIGALAILASDLTGPVADARRHFFFVLTSAAAAAALACVYFTWFVRRGLSTRRALFWALAGILCTPSWYYGTSTFDEIFAALAVTGALAYALIDRPPPARRVAFVSGLLFGLAFNVKQPLAVFVLPAIVALDRPEATRRERVTTLLLIAGGLAIGIAAYLGYDSYKFPPGTRAQHAELLKKYLLPYPGHFWLGLAVLTVSPAAGFVWYCPPVLLTMQGLRNHAARRRWVTVAFLASALVFFGFIASLSFCKGDPGWGPRYLTPLYAAFWLFAPDGAARLRARETAALLTLGLAVQLLALSVDPERLHLERRLPSTFGTFYPILYFDARVAALFNRPREIADVWRLRRERPEQFSWSDPATSAPQVVISGEVGSDPVRRYGRFTTFRPWWSSHERMPVGERPVSIAWAITVFGLLALGGVGLMSVRARE